MLFVVMKERGLHIHSSRTTVSVGHPGRLCPPGLCEGSSTAVCLSSGLAADFSFREYKPNRSQLQSSGGQ